jgi:tetratricopeptide (TPR) repeat protein
MLERAGWIVASTLLLGCTTPKPPPPPIPPPLTVEFAGCESVRRGSVCTPDAKRTLRLWIATRSDAKIDITIDGAASSSRPTEAAAGHAYQVPLPENARALRVTATRGGAKSTRTLALATDRRPDAVHKANALRLEGKLDDAEAALAALMKGSDSADHAQAVRVLARIERVRGNTKRAIKLFREAIDQERTSGSVSDEMQDRFALAFTLLYGMRAFAKARAVLDAASAIEAEYPEGKVTASYYRGLLAYETGDLRSALRLFRESAVGAQRLDLVDHQRDVLQSIADLLSTLGRYEEASERMQAAQALLGADSPPCRRAGLLNNAAWIAMRAPRSRVTDARRQRIEDQLQEARSLFEGNCATPSEAANVLTNLAIIAWDRGDLNRTEELLNRARKAVADPDPRVAVWWLTLDGHLARARKDDRAALRHFSTLERIGAASSMPEASLEGALGRAGTLADADQIDEARAAFAQADALLDRWSVEAPLGEGRETFVERHERAARTRVAFLVAAAQRQKENGPRQALLKEAVHAARWSRARALRVLQVSDRVEALPPEKRRAWETSLADYRERRAALATEAADDWRRPKDELERMIAKRQDAQKALSASLDASLARLAPSTPRSADSALPTPKPGELVVVYFPSSEGWFAFTVDREGVGVYQLGRIDAAGSVEELGRRLLDPMANALRVARRIRFAPYGALRAVDFHALIFGGEPLVQHAPVVFGVDLHPLHAVSSKGHRALVVGDPRGDLAAARTEAARVGRALRAAKWDVRSMTGTIATHDGVRDALAVEGLQLFHYAGHGVFEGRDGWESGLPLAGGTWLTIGDVLALPRVPDRVVLSGCETARTSTNTVATGLGLAQAFVVSGSREVVAAMRPVDDALAAAVAAQLTKNAEGSLDLATGLAAAQRKVSIEHPAWDWAAFRVLVR